MESLIKLININKKYDDQIIFKSLSLDILKGEILVILGDSGVGKSTFLNILSKVDKEFDGEVIYDDSIFNNISIPLPVVFQEFDQLFPWFNVKKNILLPVTKNDDIEKINIDKRFKKVVNLVGLNESLNKFPTQLSGGMKQRTAIARALMCDSKILFMDEPFGSLDSKMRKNLQKLIKKINKEYRKTIVFITHDIDEAKFIGDRILSFNDNPENYEIINLNK